MDKEFINAILTNNKLKIKDMLDKAYNNDRELVLRQVDGKKEFETTARDRTKEAVLYIDDLATVVNALGEELTALHNLSVIGFTDPVIAAQYMHSFSDTTVQKTLNKRILNSIFKIATFDDDDINAQIYIPEKTASINDLFLVKPAVIVSDGHIAYQTEPQYKGAGLRNGFEILEYAQTILPYSAGVLISAETNFISKMNPEKWCTEKGIPFINKNEKGSSNKLVDAINEGLTKAWYNRNRQVLINYAKQFQRQ